MRNNSVKLFWIWTSGSDVVCKIYLELLHPSCSAEQNHLCNFGRGLYREHSCEIILTFDEWFRDVFWRKRLCKRDGRRMKVRKATKIRNRYNHVPHLTRIPHGKVTNTQLNIKNKEPSGQPFSSRWPQGSTKTNHNSSGELKNACFICNKLHQL